MREAVRPLARFMRQITGIAFSRFAYFRTRNHRDRSHANRRVYSRQLSFMLLLQIDDELVDRPRPDVVAVGLRLGG